MSVYSLDAIYPHPDPLPEGEGEKQYPQAGLD